jgi:hypothetical protein
MTYNHQDYINSHKPKPTIPLKPGDWVTLNGAHRQLVDNFMSWLTPAHKAWQPKVGDWVRVSYDLEEHEDTKPFTYIEHEITERGLSVNSGSYWSGSSFRAKIIPWQPTKGEWCWSHYEGLVQVKLQHEEGDYKVWNPHTRMHTNIMSLEPFIGTLPSHLKDS